MWFHLNNTVYKCKSYYEDEDILHVLVAGREGNFKLG